MPPPRGTWNPLEGPADYDMTSVVHSDTYPAIDPAKADHRGKAVFIVGASRGIGLAMSVSFARSGASHIAIAARSDLSRTVKAMQDAAIGVGKPAPTVIPVRMDMTDQGSVESARLEVHNAFGRLDIVIINAGIVTTNMITESNPAEWWQTWQVNVMGPYLIMRVFIPLLLQGGDKTIITTSSVGAHCVVPTFSAYETSKLAVLRLTEFVCAEYGAKGLLAYCIHPGNVPTDLVGGLEGVAPEMRPVFVDTPELSADSLVFLTREKRDWLAGRYINVTWDLPELMEKRDEIVQMNKLKVRLII